MKTARLLILAAAAVPALMLGACKKGGDAAPTAAATGPAIPAPAGGWIEQVKRTEDGGYLMGNPDAPVKLIEYGSRTCPHCAAFAAEGIPELKSKYVSTGKVSYEFRDYPIHAPDMAAILLGQCAGPQAFFGILEQMFADQPNVFPRLENLPAGFQQAMQGKTPSQQAAMWADQLGYVTFVGQRGVPQAKAKACLADPKAADAIAQHMADGTSRYNITGTPSFVINNQPQANVVAWSQLEPNIKTALGG